MPYARKDFTGREIRSMLRGATKEGILNGWYSPMPGHYIVNPKDGRTQPYHSGTIGKYISTLYEAGVQPVFRESEPRNIV